MRLNIAAVILIAVFTACYIHAEPIDSLQKQINTKQHELYSDVEFGFHISQLEPAAIPGYLSFLLKNHLRDTLTVYHMAALVKDIAHMKRQQSQVMVSKAFVPFPSAQVYQKHCTETVAMIDDWYEEQGNDEPVIHVEKLKIDWSTHN
jgi:hypothetical protein